MQHSSSPSVRSAAALAGLVLAEVGAAALLLDMRTWVPGPTELLGADPEAALHGAAWLLASILVGWLLVTTAGAVIVRLCRMRVAPLDWITLPPIRRLAERATAITLVASSIATPSASLASEAPPIPVVVVVETSPATSTEGAPAPTEAQPEISPLPIVGHVVAPPLRAAAVATAPATGGFPSAYPFAIPHIDQSTSGDPEFQRHVVAPGESMWTITADHLTDHLGARPSNAQISELWRIVMDLNRDSIRSGDVDLIFPGEELLLPALEA